MNTKVEQNNNKKAAKQQCQFCIGGYQTIIKTPEGEKSVHVGAHPNISSVEEAFRNK